MMSFDIIETPEMIIEKMLSDLDVWITPFAEIDSVAFKHIYQLDTFVHRANTLRQNDPMARIDQGQLTGPIMQRMLYQYCAIVGQLEIHARMISNERTTFLKRAKETYGSIIEWIERTYDVGHPVQVF